MVPAASIFVIDVAATEVMFSPIRDPVGRPPGAALWGCYPSVVAIA
jgi:hypothetical protein